MPNKSGKPPGLQWFDRGAYEKATFNFTAEQWSVHLLFRYQMEHLFNLQLHTEEWCAKVINAFFQDPLLVEKFYVHQDSSDSVVNLQTLGEADKQEWKNRFQWILNYSDCEFTAHDDRNVAHNLGLGFDSICSLTIADAKSISNNLKRLDTLDGNAPESRIYDDALHNYEYSELDGNNRSRHIKNEAIVSKILPSHAHLIINLSRSNQEIKTQFDTWLTNSRKHYGYKIHKITSDKLRMLHQKKVLQYIDMYLCGRNSGYIWSDQEYYDAFCAPDPNDVTLEEFDELSERDIRNVLSPIKNEVSRILEINYINALRIAGSLTLNG